MNPARHLSGKFRQGAQLTLCLAAGLLAALFLTSPLASAAPADPLDVWYPRPFVASNGLRTVTYAGGKFVAGGSEILTSTDGANWQRHTLATNDYIMGLAYGQGVYVAAAGGGRLHSSADAARWTVRADTRGELWSVTCGNGVFVAVGSYARPGSGPVPVAHTSSNGVDWVRHEINGPGWPLLSATFGDGTFVASGANGAIYTSPDGAQWTLRPSPVAWSLHGLTYGGGTFLITSGNLALVSTNGGVHWETNAIARPDSSFNEAGYAEGTFVAVGFAGDRVATSPDGLHWTTRIPAGTSASGDAFLGVAYGGARFIVVGNKVLQSGPLVPAPPILLQQPQSRVVRVGNTYTNSVVAEEFSPLTYQWRRDGVALPGATNAILLIPNAPLSLSGEHSVVVTGSGGATTSAVATVRVAAPPAIVVQPLDQSVGQGGAAVFSVEVTGTPPIAYRWRRDGSGSNVLVSDSLRSFLMVSNVQAGASYTVAITNLVSMPPGVLSATARLTVLPDTDGDGLPDTFETAHGLDPANPADAPLDADGDGLSNAAEYQTGTDPTNPASYLKVDRVTVAGEARIEFISQAGKTYVVEFSDNLVSGLWSRLTQLPARPASRAEVVFDPAPAPTRFYRLATPATP